MEYIENDYLKIGVLEHGAELASVYDKINARDVLWNADKAYWARHAPVLFPIVGKVKNNEYTFNGNKYSLGQHGFARDLDFKIVVKTLDSIKHILKSDPQTKERYPFDFEFRVTHTLENKTLKVSWEVTNTGDSDMYFSVGAHPAFNVPVAGSGANKSDYYLYLEKSNGAPLTYKLLEGGKGTVDDEKQYTIEDDNGYVRVSEKLFENDALIFDENKLQKASICHPDKSPYVTIEAKGFPAFGIWTPPMKNAPFICLEPWYGRADSSNFSGDFKNKYLTQKLEAHKTFEASYKIVIA